MKLGRLVVTSFSRNWLRSLFTFAAIVAGFCLFGALETIRYEREGPSTERDVIIVQADGSGSFPRTYEDTVLAMKGVKAAVGLTMFPAQNAKAPTQPLIVLAANPAMVPETFPGLGISADVAARWRDTRIGAICDRRTAEGMGWKAGDHITLPLMQGMRTASGGADFEVILLATYPAGLSVSGLVIRRDYAGELFPQNAQLLVMFVRPERASEARPIAQRIDEQFKSGPAQTLSAPLYEARQSSARDASTVRMVIQGALAISFFTMVLIVTNALTQSARERIGEMAVLQALGFQQSTVLLLIFAEAFVLFLVGALLGLALSNLGFAFEIAGMRADAEILPAHTILMAIAYAAVCALISTLPPWRELSRYPLAEALSRS